MTGAIRVLPEDLVNRIAAGEVIERPASVVKELVENAIDAGAERVRIDLQDGGATLVRVTDDGRGMGEDDLRLAFVSHATSKLASDEDLFRVETLGFRGEALASIGAVSMARIVSRTRDAAVGAAISCEGGVLSPLVPTGAPTGTTVEVRNLFFNTPARRKFLKSASTEMAALTDTVERLALGHPRVGFDLFHNGREVLRAPLDSSVRERIGLFFGRDLESALVPFDLRSGDVAVLGFAAGPSQNRPRADAVWFFLNGRSIRDRGLAHAIQHAYRELLPPGRHPAAFTFLSIDPASVDVNVHPTKAEVRLARPAVVHDAIVAAIRRALDVPARLAIDVRPAPFDAGSEGTPAPEPAAPDARGGDAVRDAAERFGSGAAGFFFRPAARALGPDREPISAAEERPPAPEARPPAAAPSGRPSGRFLQVHDSYIVVETADGIAVLDQHALHEGVQHHRIEKELEKGAIPPQRLLVPETVELRPGDAEILEALRPELERIGFLVDAVSSMRASIRGVPAARPHLRAARFVEEALQAARHDEAAAPEGRERDKLLSRLVDTLACRSAVTAGTRLAPEAVSELVSMWEREPHAATCAHGRPSAIRIRLGDLEKWFLRK